MLFKANVNPAVNAKVIKKGFCHLVNYISAICRNIAQITGNRYTVRLFGHCNNIAQCDRLHNRTQKMIPILSPALDIKSHIYFGVRFQRYHNLSINFLRRSSASSMFSTEYA